MANQDRRIGPIDEQRQLRCQRIGVIDVVATTYSSIVFGGSILIWAFNLLLAAVRGTGNLLLPVGIVCGGMLILLPLSPILIFGLGPLPAFGVAGAATAVLLYYAGGSLCFALFLCGGGCTLRATAPILGAFP